MPPSPDNAPRSGTELLPLRLLIAMGAAGLVLAALASFLYSSLTWRAAREGREALDLTGEMVQGTLEAEVSCRLYLASGDAKSLAIFRAALDRSRKSADDLATLAVRLEAGDVTLVPAVHETVKRLAAWEESFAAPATAMKRGGQSQKLSAFNRKGTGGGLSLALRDSLESLRAASAAAVSRNSARAEFRGNLCLALLGTGLLLLAAAAAMLIRRTLAVFHQLRGHSDALELLAQWSERIQRIYSEDQAARLLAGTITGDLGMARATVMLKAAGDEAMRTVADNSPAGPPKTAAPEERDPADCPATRDGQRVVIMEPGREHACNCPLANGAPGGYVCLPLTAQGGVVGVVRAESPRGTTAGRRTIERLESLVRLTSITLNTLLSLADAKQQATIDGLTGIFNRRFLDAYLEKQMKVSVRTGHELVVLMMDLDLFKKFNDHYGHAAGDALLRVFARTMAASLRESDLAARYGGEEFTSVMVNTNRSEGMLTAERIRAAVEAMTLDILPSLPPPVATVSIGVACFPADGNTVAALMHAADEALYRAKEGGRNRVVSA